MVQYAGATTEERRKALAQRIGSDRVLQMFDDDGDGLLAGEDLATLETVLADADDVVTGILIKKAWTSTQLEVIATDRQVVRAWTGIAAQLAGRRKPEWLNADGQGPFHAFGVEGRTDLGALARGETRSAQEDAVGGGVNRSIAGYSDDHPREFAPDPSIPGHRGNGSF